jgi:hypothetical protein
MLTLSTSVDDADEMQTVHVKHLYTTRIADENRHETMFSYIVSFFNLLLFEYLFKNDKTDECIAQRLAMSIALLSTSGNFEDKHEHE